MCNKATTVPGGRNLFFGRERNLPVTDCTQLRDYLPAEKKHHYRCGYSMAEACKSWLAADGRLPCSIARVIGDRELIAAHFEYPTRVWGGGKSMTDVMAFVRDGVVAVEAKVNESFGNVVSEWIFEEEISNERSPPGRTKAILRYASAFGVRSPRLLGIRYQLLHRTLSAARAAQSRRLSKAWMIVQSFSPTETDTYRRNRDDFDCFVALVGEAPTIEGVLVKLAWVSDDPMPQDGPRSTA